MKKNIKILRIIATLDPKFGGPQHGIIESSKHLIQNGYKVDIVTIDKKKYLNLNLNYKNLRIINFSDSIGKDYRFSFKLFLWLLKSKKYYDYFIIHGLWQFPTLLARIVLKTKYFVFTHGMLDPFFRLNFFKKIKKQIYWYLIEYKNLQKADSILLTSIGERKCLKNTYVKTDKLNTKIIKYGMFKKNINQKSAINKFNLKFPFLKKVNFYLFLGRFHEKKGCEIIIESIYRFSNKIKTPVLLAGPMLNTTYERFLKSLVKKYNLKNKIIFSDAIFDEIKWGAILNCRAMLLPSHGENFGVAIAEALSVGKPVIITKKVNIASIISKYKAGYTLSDNVKSFSKGLKKFEKLNHSSLNKISKNAKLCFDENFNLELGKYNLYELFTKPK